MNSPNYEGVRRYVYNRLENEIDQRIGYHCIVHTRDDVMPALERLATTEDINNPEDLLVLRTAALYHDLGFIEQYAEHETASIRLARQTLPRFGYPPHLIERICQVIQATIMPQRPNSLLEQIMADADLDILGREDFIERNGDLYHELAAMGKAPPLSEWNLNQLTFIQNHHYFTDSETCFRQAGKERNIAKLQDMLLEPGRRLPSYDDSEAGLKAFAMVLRQAPLFQDLPEDEIMLLAGILERVQLPANTILFLEGDYGEHFYVIIEGRVEIVKGMTTPEEHRLGIRGPGEFIGEMSLINRDGHRTASARSIDNLTMLVMTRHEFDELLTRQPQLAYKLMRVLSARLDASHNHAIQELQEKNRQLTQAYVELKAAQQGLVEKEVLERELEVAYEIQMSILPLKLPSIPGCEFGGLMIPARKVGGDFYDVIIFDEDRVGLIVGDVTDKGIPAAIYMARIHALLHAAAKPNLSPSEVLHQINQQLLVIDRRLLFATVIYGILNRKDNSFIYARAGHELPLLRHANGEIEIPPLGVGMPLGLIPKPRIDEGMLFLPPGSTLLLYSDGVTDARSPERLTFGEEGLVKLLSQEQNLTAQQLCNSILQTLTAWQPPHIQDDDITLVAVRYQ